MCSVAFQGFGISHGIANRAVETHGTLWIPLITGEKTSEQKRQSVVTILQPLPHNDTDHLRHLLPVSVKMDSPCMPGNTSGWS
jgi:hypothetical protein